LLRIVSKSAIPSAKLDLRRAEYQRIYATVDSIPPGRVATYGQVAMEAGLPGRARMVGFALRALPTASELPWHRVVNAAGGISPRSGGGARAQAIRLAREGVVLRRGRSIDLRRFGWVPVE
jgi:methylated-DNA-protein-cysteine methyltransferase-like protein